MRNKFISLFSLILAATELSGCISQSRIQSKYVSREGECRDMAQLRALERQKTGVQGATADTPTETSYMIASAFSECMNKEGWKVTTPKPPSAPPPTNTAVVVTPPPSGAPGPGGTVASTRAPAVSNATTPASPILGPGVQPDPAPAFTPAPPVRNGAAPAIPSTATYAPQAPASLPVQGTYTPPSGYTNYTPQYGAGAGRQF